MILQVLLSRYSRNPDFRCIVTSHNNSCPGMGRAQHHTIKDTTQSFRTVSLRRDDGNGRDGAGNTQVRFSTHYYFRRMVNFTHPTPT